MLKFFGDGGAFSVNRGQNCAFYFSGKTMIILDCGFCCLEKIITNKMLKNIDEVQIFITHLHNDHIAGLTTLIEFMDYCCSNLTYKIFYPNARNLIKLIELMRGRDMKNLVSQPKQSQFLVEVLEQEHMPFSYGYILKIDDKTIFYSGDAKHVNQRALELFLSGEIDLMYHEVTLTNSSGVHTSLEELEQKIPPKLRNKVYCMHLSDEAAKLVVEKGFRLVDLAF